MYSKRTDFHRRPIDGFSLPTQNLYVLYWRKYLSNLGMFCNLLTLARLCCYKINRKFSNNNTLIPERFRSIVKTARILKTKQSLTKEFLYGISPCLTALQANRRKFYIVYCNEDVMDTNSRLEYKMIKALAKKRNITLKTVSRKRMVELAGNRPHQNVIIKASNFSYIDLQNTGDFLPKMNTKKGRAEIWLVLDGIQDPMNMGAILRTACFLGVDKVIASRYNSCALTPVVSKASAGCMEMLQVYSTNVVQLLELSRVKCEVYATVPPNFTPQDPNCSMVQVNQQLKLEKPSLLVLGNEGKGLSPEILKLCTKYLTICNQSNKMQHLDSLNVSVAAGT